MEDDDCDLVCIIPLTTEARNRFTVRAFESGKEIILCRTNDWNEAEQVFSHNLKRYVGISVSFYQEEMVL